MDGKTPICVWPCGTWCHEEKLEEYGFMSDDFIKAWVPEELDDESIGVLADDLVN